tara:strand:+ start:30 stop:383 length:354 start_codon:yes stop_codon:yes gene_type:complete
MGITTNSFVPHTKACTVVQAVSSTIAHAALTTIPGDLYDFNVILTYFGTAGEPAFFSLGSVAGSASANADMCILAGQTLVVERGRATHLNVIASADKTGVIYATTGLGDPQAAGGIL